MNTSERFEEMKKFFTEAAGKISSELMNWITILVLHASTVPTFMAIMLGVSDNPPPIDITLFIWISLVIMFIKAAIDKNMLNIVTIGIGFFIQASLLVLIFFK